MTTEFQCNVCGAQGSEPCLDVCGNGLDYRHNQANPIDNRNSMGYKKSMATDKREFHGGEIKVENTINDIVSDHVVIRYHDLSIAVIRNHSDGKVRCEFTLGVDGKDDEITEFVLGQLGYSVRFVDHG